MCSGSLLSVLCPSEGTEGQPVVSRLDTRPTLNCSRVNQAKGTVFISVGIGQWEVFLNDVLPEEPKRG
jgi:hypothetical protein